MTTNNSCDNNFPSLTKVSSFNFTGSLFNRAFYTDENSETTGTMSASGTALTGSGSQFTTVNPGAIIIFNDGTYGVVKRVISDTSITLFESVGTKSSQPTNIVYNAFSIVYENGGAFISLGESDANIFVGDPSFTLNTGTITIRSLPTSSFKMNINPSDVAANVNYTIPDIKDNGKFFVSSQHGVTQITSITTGVTLPSSSGNITTVSSTIASQATAAFTVTAPFYTSANQVVHATISNGTNTGGAPQVWVSALTPGSNTFVINLFNSTTAANAFNGTLKIQVSIV